MKGYRVYVSEDKNAVVTLHARNMKTLTGERNMQLRRVHLDESDDMPEDVDTTKRGGISHDR